jgi:hypothetical protein
MPTRENSCKLRTIVSLVSFKHVHTSIVTYHLTKFSYQDFLMESITNSLDFARAHRRSPSAATIHSKPARLEREWLPCHSSCRWAAVNKDGGVLYGDTSSASHPPLMSMPSQKHQVSVGSARSRRRAAACQPPCHDDGTPGWTAPRNSSG